MASLYEEDPLPSPRQGSLYQYKPVFWIEPPLIIVRHIDFSASRAWIYREPHLPRDAFRRADEDHQEDVLARAKIRYVVVLSPDYEADLGRIQELVIAPVYSLPADRPTIVERIKALPDHLYLPRDDQFPDVGEAFVNFRNVQPLSKRFLGEGKMPFRLGQTARDALIKRYRDYFLATPPRPH